MAQASLRGPNCTPKPPSSNSCRKNGDGIENGFVLAREKRPLTVGQRIHRRILDRWIRRGIWMAHGWGICLPILKGNRNTVRGVTCKIIGWGLIGVGRATHLAKQGFSSERKERYDTHRARRSLLMELAAG